LGYSFVEQMSRASGAFRGVRLGCLIFEVSGRSVENDVPFGRVRTDDAFVADPSRGGSYVGIVVELGLVAVVLVRVVVDVGVGEDLDPGAIPLDDDDLVAWGDERDFFGVGVRCDVDICGMHNGGGRRFGVVLCLTLTF